jgi:predicted O-methyltransferase YrrM
VALPKAVRTLTPGQLRDDPRLRAFALLAGLIPPRIMHTAAEARVLGDLARGARRVVELGVYEGSSALIFCDVLRGGELHLIDPFSDTTGWAMRPGWHGTPRATQAVVRRRARSGGAQVRWHVARSQEVGRDWAGGPVDLVFVDGDHSPQGCREDWEVWHPHVRAGGAVAFHDARLGHPAGLGSPGPTGVVDELFRATPPAGWRITHEVDSLVVVQRSRER